MSVLKKFIFILFQLCAVVSLLQAQEERRMQLLSSSHSRLDGETGHMINYRPVYEHKGSTLSADSGYLYNDELGREFFDAFGNVVITQPNGTMIYAHKLNYTAESQLAVLTGNVRMVDGNSVLTTNYLTYNMRGGIGTYTGGGRIINQADTITSKNAWYFRETQDAYFRHEVIVRTPDVHIFTDTMRYNSGEKTTYFYGPTNLKGKKGENLYTEEGFYNTESELAEFYKNNLYTETSRLLRGDTLYYDGTSGNGRALRNVHFVDTADQFYADGMQGLYNKEDESILLTDQALITMVMKEDEKVDSVYMTADTLYSRMILLRDYVAKEFNLDREGGAVEEPEEDFGELGMEDSLGADEAAPMRLDSLSMDSLGVEAVRVDSLRLDSLGVEVVQVDSLRTDSIREDSLIADSAKIKFPPKIDSTITKSTATSPAELITQELAADSLLRQKTIFPTGNEVDSLMMQAALAMEKPKIPDSLARDSLQSDTAKTRIIKAYRNVRLFKSDLQAVADSAYYGYPDSMMRFFGSPMAWAQGSQLSGDSLYIQIKNEKIDNLLLINRAFIVSTKQDSSKFNQIKGRKITGFFTAGELERLFVDGNAESIAYRENKEKTGYTDMHHNRSSRIKILLRNDELTDFIPIKSTEGTIYPLHLLRPEQEILDGFIWKPGDRPRSKEDLMRRKRVSGAPVEQLGEPDDPDGGPDDPDGRPDEPVSGPAVPVKGSDDPEKKN